MEFRKYATNYTLPIPNFTNCITLKLRLLKTITKIDKKIRVSNENFCLSFFFKKADLMAITKSSLPVAIFLNIQIT